MMNLVLLCVALQIAAAQAGSAVLRSKDSSTLKISPVRRQKKRITDSAEQTTAMPNLDELVRELDKAMEPYQLKYRESIGLPHPSGAVLMMTSQEVSTCKAGFQKEIPNTYLGGCPDGGCQQFPSLEEAQAKCCTIDSCGGVIRAGQTFELRNSYDTSPSESGEASYPREAHHKKKAYSLWQQFASVMDGALSNSSLNLKKKFEKPRDDDSIFVAVASYRDDNCPATLRRAFEQADHPERLNVGVVQINCEAQHGCKWATGWADTRRIIDKKDPDEDCLSAFCASPQGMPHCKADRARILRLPESMAMGPFFTRYLNSFLWRGETFYMQVDAHVDFREGWDTDIIGQMKRTPSYPHSVISNYPPSGNPKQNRLWRREETSDDERIPSALCGASFEEVEGRYTVRMQQNSRVFDANDVPRHSGFIAAGFFIAHASILSKVPFDPFMPYLFMGEEIVLAARFWTAGFDIYAPTKDIVSHDYGRHEAPKFWETVNMVFDDPGVHNDLTQLVIQRVQHLIGFPEAQKEEQLTSISPSLLVRANEFGAGNVRTMKDFVEQMQLDLANKRQSPPSWCTHGQLPPLHLTVNELS